jgi:hypothetical protein
MKVFFSEPLETLQLEPKIATKTTFRESSHLSFPTEKIEKFQPQAELELRLAEQKLLIYALSELYREKIETCPHPPSYMFLKNA